MAQGSKALFMARLAFGITRANVSQTHHYLLLSFTTLSEWLEKFHTYLQRVLRLGRTALIEERKYNVFSVVFQLSKILEKINKIVHFIITNTKHKNTLKIEVLNTPVGITLDQHFVNHIVKLILCQKEADQADKYSYITCLVSFKVHNFQTLEICLHFWPLFLSTFFSTTSVISN